MNTDARCPPDGQIRTLKAELTARAALDKAARQLLAYCTMATDAEATNAERMRARRHVEAALRLSSA